MVSLGPAPRRIAITGMGAVSALGLGAPTLWDAMVHARSGIAPLVPPAGESGIRMAVAAALPAFDPTAHFSASQLPLLDRVSQFALLAADEAIAQSGLALEGQQAMRTAVVVGTGIGGETTREEQSRRIFRDGAERVHPMAIIRIMPSAPASQIGMRHKLRGPTFAVSSACASSNHAIAQAALMVRHGLVDFAIAGGAEACFTLSAIRAWEAMRVVADDTCRPFSARRRGLVLGEGAAIFVLETMDHARERGADVLAELAGFGCGADAGDIVAPSAEGAALAMRAALADSGLRAEDIDYVNAHGTGTPLNDATETRAIRQAFGNHANQLAVSSTKAVHGHALGAAGALELVAVIGALREQVAPPTTNFLEPDPACDLDYVPNIARPMPIRAALSNSFAFGGLNAVLALARG